MRSGTQQTLTLVAAAFCSLLHAATVSAHEPAPVDLSGFWTVKFEPDPSNTELYDKIPDSAVFIDDAGGGELAAGEYDGLKLSEKAKEEVRSHDFAAEFDRENTCVAPSAAYYMQAPFPLEIHQADRLVVLQMEYFDMVRIIHLDQTEIPDNVPHSKNGYSIGHWDGDELVVRTERMSSSTLLNNGFNHSENIVMHERFALSDDGQTLSLIQTYEDPEVFTGIAARYMSWRKVPGEHVYPYECDPSFGR